MFSSFQSLLNYLSLLNAIVDYKRNLPWEDSRQIIVGRFRGNFRLGKGAQDEYEQEGKKFILLS